jgi:general secretion pathway protein C
MIKYVFSIINVLLITAVSFFSVKLFYQVVSAKLTQASFAAQVINLNKPIVDISDQQTPILRQKKQNFLSYQMIISRDVFKASQGKSDKSSEQIELDKLKQTQLNLKLCGTVTGNSDQAYAVIEKTQNRKQELFREGDSIENALIKKILRNTVVLNVNGKDEILVIKEENKKSAQAPVVAATEGEMPVPEAGEEPPPEEQTGEAVAIERDKVNGALKNINQLMSQVRIRPFFQNGKPSGLMLSHIQPNSIFIDMGLQSGDVVKGVNGNAIESVDDALKFYESLKSSSSVQLQIERQGQQMNIDYKIN